MSIHSEDALGRAFSQLPIPFENNDFQVLRLTDETMKSLGVEENQKNDQEDLSLLALYLISPVMVGS